jgi:sulfur relay (sulfurtransferase) DsrF/TusC family protein
MNVEDIKIDNYNNILHAELKFDLEHDYIVDCKLVGKGFDEKNNIFTIQALDLSIRSIIDAYHYGSKREYESDLKTIKK